MASVNQTDRVKQVFARIQEWNPRFQQVYVDEFYANILKAGFNAATIQQAFGLAQIVEDVGPITLRGAFYRAVSSGLFPDTDDKHYRAAGNIVLKLRRTGCVRFTKIVDSTRRRLKPSSWSGLTDFLDTVQGTYRKDLWSRQDSYIEVFVEKDAMAGVLEPVTSEFDVPLNVIRGDISETFVWNIAEIWKQIPKIIYCYYLGDHDPSGLRLEQTLKEKLFHYTPHSSRIIWRRLAIDPADFQNENIIGFPIKGNRNDKAWQTKHRDYLEQHGDRCVEIDALAPDDIRKRLADAITHHIDPQEWVKLQEIEAAERDTISQFVLAQKVGGEAA